MILDLWEKDMCQVVIVPHNFTNKFQPLDITLDKTVKPFILNKYNECFSKQGPKQLEKGIKLAYVKVHLGLTEPKVMHAKCIFKLYNH